MNSPAPRKTWTKRKRKYVNDICSPCLFIANRPVALLLFNSNSLGCTNWFYEIASCSSETIACPFLINIPVASKLQQCVRIRSMSSVYLSVCLLLSACLICTGDTFLIQTSAWIILSVWIIRFDSLCWLLLICFVFIIAFFIPKHNSLRLCCFTEHIVIMKIHWNHLLWPSTLTGDFYVHIGSDIPRYDYNNQLPLCTCNWSTVKTV